MKKISYLCSFFILLFYGAFYVQAEVKFDRERLFAIPETFNATQEKLDFEVSEHIRPILLEGEVFRGKPSRIFAWYGVPTTGKPPYPAVVLVHGGGGSAFSEWVQRWNERGFVALALDVQGRIPTSPWEGRAISRPLAGGAEVNNLNPADPLEEQWPFHAVSAIIRAHSLLRSFSEVDKEHIGLVGISWGGFLSCIVAGVDDRFQYVIPIYGCGFLGDPELTRTVMPLAKFSEAEQKLWLNDWDPSVYLPNATMPVFFITDCDDSAYPLDRWLRSTRLVSQSPRYFLSHTFGHSHSAGDRPEAVRFAKAMAQNATMIPVFSNVTLNDAGVTASFSGGEAPFKAELLYTNEAFSGKKRVWRVLPAVVHGNTITAQLPPGCAMAFLNLSDAEGTVSTLVKE